MSRLTRDGTAESVSRDQILRHARGQGNVHFPCSADHEQDWQPYQVDPYSAICDDHTATVPILPVVTKDLPISPRFLPSAFSSRCKFSPRTTRRPMVEFRIFPSLPGSRLRIFYCDANSALLQIVDRRLTFILIVDLRSKESKPPIATRDRPPPTTLPPTPSRRGWHYSSSSRTKPASSVTVVLCSYCCTSNGLKSHQETEHIHI